MPSESPYMLTTPHRCSLKSVSIYGEREHLCGSKSQAERPRGGGVLTAATLLEMAERDGVRVGVSSSGGLKASGPRDALARWLPELKAMKPAIAAAVAQVNDAARPLLRLRSTSPFRFRRACAAGPGRAMVLRRASSARRGASMSDRLTRRQYRHTRPLGRRFGCVGIANGGGMDCGA